MNRASPRALAFPFVIGTDGRAAGTDEAAHIREMIEQLVLTNPGERVNRPDFGGGLARALFAPNTVELQATLQFTLLASLQQYLGDLIECDGLEVAAEGEQLTVTMSYRILRTGERAEMRFGTAVS